MKSDALGLARHAELRTVDANQTVFQQRSFPPLFCFRFLFFVSLFFSISSFSIRVISFKNNNL